MKKFFFLAVFFILGAALSAQIELGEFPLGTWLDANYSAYWELSSNNIVITDGAGKVYFDFTANTVEDFKVSVEIAGIVMTWSCAETGKKYKLTKPLTDFNLILDIDPPWNRHYKTTMAKQ